MALMNDANGTTGLAVGVVISKERVDPAGECIGLRGMNDRNANAQAGGSQ